MGSGAVWRGLVRSGAVWYVWGGNMVHSQQLAALRRDLREAFPSSIPSLNADGKLHSAFSGLSTALPGLDQLLAGQGLPKGRISELTGATTSGKTAVALQIVAAATKAGQAVAWIDLPRAFFPPSAQAAGVQLDRLVIIRPADVTEALKAADILLRGQSFALIVFDWASEPAHRSGASRAGASRADAARAGAAQAGASRGDGTPAESTRARTAQPTPSLDPGAAIARLNGLCSLSETVLLFITTPKTAREPLRYYATVRLEIQRQAPAPTVSPVESESLKGGDAPPPVRLESGEMPPVGAQSALESHPNRARLRLVGLPMRPASPSIAIRMVKNKLGAPEGRCEVGLNGNETHWMPLHSGLPNTSPTP